MNHFYTKRTAKKSRFGKTLCYKVGANKTQVLNRQKSSFYKLVLFIIGGILFTPTIWAQSFLHDMKSRFRYIQPREGTLISGFAPMMEIEGINGQADADTLGFEATQEVFRLGLLNEYGINKYDLQRAKYQERQEEFIGIGVLPIGLVDIKYQVANPALERQNRVSISDDSSYRFDLNGFDG